MGFFDKIKTTITKIKEENKYMVRTTARINSNALYGTVNFRTGKINPDDDFRMGSYVNVEGSKGIIYNTGDEDYEFFAGDFASFTFTGPGKPVKQGEVDVPTLRFTFEFKDGKKSYMDLLHNKVDAFKLTFNLQ